MKIKQNLANSSRPNIVIVIADDMRADAFGKTSVPTPNLDAFSADSVTFTQNFAVNPVCAPSRISNFTGLYPQVNGHRSLYQLLRPHEENLFHILKDDGYEVVMTGKNDLMTTNSIKVSFDRRLASQQSINAELIHERLQALPLRDRCELSWLAFRFQKLAQKPPNRIQENLKLNKLLSLNPGKRNPFPPGHRLHHAFYFGRAEPDESVAQMDDRIMASAKRYLQSQPKSPFCLYIALTLPHTPYCVEEPYFSTVSRAAMTDIIPAKLEDKPHFMRELYRRYGMAQLTDEDYREIRATYYGMIVKLDHVFGQLIAELKAKGLYENTMVVFMSDHGDYAGDYGLPEKWPTGFQDVLLHTPLIVKFPGNTHAGEKIDAFTQSIDVFPTVLEAAQVNTPYTHFGQSLLPLSKGAAGRDAVFATGGYDPREPQCFETGVDSPDDPFMGQYYEKMKLQREDPTTVARTAMVRTQEWKLVIRTAGKEELYHLSEDPQELINRIDDHALIPLVQQLKDQLLTWYLRTSDNPHWEHERSV